ncbi:MAG TPA: hypothetical protein PK185_07780 [Cyclobacteriaceae bacterium]|nr:hypothetical protein [Cyclobacteriaceae bacterium]
MNKVTLFLGVAIFGILLLSNSFKAKAGYCYAKFNGEFCDLNNPANCIEECSIVEED